MIPSKIIYTQSQIDVWTAMMNPKPHEIENGLEYGTWSAKVGEVSERTMADAKKKKKKSQKKRTVTDTMKKCSVVCVRRFCADVCRRKCILVGECEMADWAHDNQIQWFTVNNFDAIFYETLFLLSMPAQKLIIPTRYQGENGREKMTIYLQQLPHINMQAKRGREWARKWSSSEKKKKYPNKRSNIDT